MPTQDRIQMMAKFDGDAAELRPSTWRFLACELARAVIHYRKEKDYWQGYWIESLARTVLAKDVDDGRK